MDFNQKVGTNLKEWREEFTLSQRGLSAKTGISQGMISRWERGENLPSIRDLVTLADFYGITLDELIGRKI